MIWEPGDTALCTASMQPAQGLPERGTLWTVAAVCVIELDGIPEPMLRLQGFPDQFWFCGKLFTKLGGHLPDADDAEVIRAMSRQRAPV